MFSRDLWGEIWHSIKNNKLRTFLTGFSVAWGIFILVLLLASVKGMQNGFMKQFNDDATNSIFIYPNVTTKPYGGFEAGRRIIFRNDDIEYIKGSFEGYFEHITPQYYKSVTAKYKKETGNYNISAVNPDHIFIERTTIADGRYINVNDMKNTSKVLVIGRMVAKDLFKDEDPIGKQIIINGLAFKVVGLFTDDGNDREERRIYAPVSTFQRLYGNTDEINQIALTYNPTFDFTKAINFSNRLEEVLKRRFNIAPDDQGAIYLNNYAEGFSDISNFTGMLSIISIGVGVLILLAGIVGIGNILVFIIKERTKEIGIRKALGARPVEIIKLVLLESVFITSVSGLTGMLFAMGVVSLISPLVDTPAFSNPSVDNITVITSTIVLVVAGVIAGLVPAIKAANVKPIVALSSN